VNATATSTANPFFWGRSTGNLQMTSFKNHHILGSGGTPTWTATGAGTGYTATAAGNDLGQILTLTTGTSSTAGIVATGSSAAILYGISGALSVTAGNAAAALLMAAAAGAPYILKNGTSGWILTIPGTPADSTAYKFHILTLG